MTVCVCVSVYEPLQVLVCLLVLVCKVTIKTSKELSEKRKKERNYDDFVDH